MKSRKNTIKRGGAQVFVDASDVNVLLGKGDGPLKVYESGLPSARRGAGESGLGISFPDLHTYSVGRIDHILLKPGEIGSKEDPVSNPESFTDLEAISILGGSKHKSKKSRKSKKSKKTKKGRGAYEGGKKKCPKHCRRHTRRTRKGLKHRKN